MAVIPHAVDCKHNFVSTALAKYQHATQPNHHSLPHSNSEAKLSPSLSIPMAPSTSSTTLRAIRERLEEMWNDVRAEYLRLLDIGRVYPFHREEIRRLFRPLYGPEETDMPAVYDREYLPWKQEPNIPAIQAELSATLDEQEDYSSRKTLLQNVTSPLFYTGKNEYITLPCRHLDEITERTLSPAASDASSMACDIMSAGGLRQSLTSEHEVSILMTGTRVWIMYPPTVHNLKLFKRVFLLEQMSPRTAELSAKLEGGLIYLQTPGETVVTPPRCCLIVISIQASVAAFYDVRLKCETPEQLPVPSSIAEALSSEQTDESREEFLCSYSERLHDILNNTVPSVYNTTQRIEEIIETWDDEKEGLRALCNSLPDGDEWADMFARLWADYAIGQVDILACALCDDAFDARIWTATSQGKLKLLEDHFLKAHWN